MILFYGEGRLGNQLFQYQALASLARAGESILAIGLEDLAGGLVLAGPRLRVLRLGYWGKRAAKYLLVPLLLRPLGRNLRLCGYAREPADVGPPSVRDGLLRSLRFVDGGYFQQPAGWPRRFPAGVARAPAEVRQAAQEYLRMQCAPGSTPVFVHVRRGDYLEHGWDEDGSLALPASWYREAIALVRARIAQPHFVFVTDDPAWVDQAFADVTPRSLHAGGMVSDWTLLSTCRAGILSNSTFSLSAALHMVHPALLVAPLHWLGFRQRQWIPAGIELHEPFICYLPVSVPATGPSA